MSGSDEIVAFILARLDEDETNIEGDWSAGDGGLHIISEPMHRRLLADVEAKRRIVYFCPASIGGRTEWGLTCLTLAAIWADHPDYRSEWAPSRPLSDSVRDEMRP